MTIRNYQSQDYNAAIELFTDAYAGIDDNFASYEDMEALRLHYPEGQLLAFDSAGNIAGGIFSLYCRYDYFLENRPCMKDIYNPAHFQKHTTAADSLFALEILVKSTHQRQGIGRLLNQHLSDVLVRHNLKAFIGVSRLSAYANVQTQMSPETYIQKVLAGELIDPALSYNCSNQMLPVKVIPEYYPADKASAGFGALVIQHNPQYKPSTTYNIDIDELLDGQFGISILPPNTLINIDSCGHIVERLKQTPYTFDYPPYPPCWGKAFENYLTMREYFTPEPNDDLFNTLCQPITDKIIALLEAKGIKVETLIDPTYQQAYTQANFRINPVPAQLSMLHVDDIRLDGSVKPDFILPPQLSNHDYTQLSVIVQLDDSNSSAKGIRIYDKKYTAQDDQYRLENAWQFSDEAIANCTYLDYQPQVGEAFIMPNQYFHDILGGTTDTNWIMYSLYILYIKEDNLALIYI